MVFDAGQQIYTTEMLALNIYRTFTMNWKWQGVGQAKAVMFFIWWPASPCSSFLRPAAVQQ